MDYLKFFLRVFASLREISPCPPRLRGEFFQSTAYSLLPMAYPRPTIPIIHEKPFRPKIPKNDKKYKN